jgi:hypothetical protein
MIKESRTFIELLLSLVLKSIYSFLSGYSFIADVIVIKQIPTTIIRAKTMKSTATKSKRVRSKN